jgi:hypothetical protein
MKIASLIVFAIVFAIGALLLRVPDRPICGALLATDISGCDISFKDTSK